MWEELGISAGTAIIILIALYFIIKWGVKNGVKEAFTDITGEETFEAKKIKEMYGYYDSEEEADSSKEVAENLEDD